MYVLWLLDVVCEPVAGFERERQNTGPLQTKKTFQCSKNLIIFQKKYFIVSKFDHRLGPKFVDFIPI